MFTGIVSNIGVIESAEQQGDLCVAIACDYAPESLKLGESVAVNGVCLTVVEFSSLRGANAPKQSSMEQQTGLLRCARTDASCFTVTLSAETLRCTAPGQWQKGKKVNLERSLKLGDTLGGHMVTGHVDGVTTIKGIKAAGDSHILMLEAPDGLMHFIAEKGSVCLGGVSLTVNKVEENTFWINIIPHTWQNTTLGEHKPGDALNLEIDLIARYVANLLKNIKYPL